MPWLSVGAAWGRLTGLIITALAKNMDSSLPISLSAYTVRLPSSPPQVPIQASWTIVVKDAIGMVLSQNTSGDQTRSDWCVDDHCSPCDRAADSFLVTYREAAQ